MAYTVTNTFKTVFGDKRVHLLDITADATTQNVDTGLDYVYGYAVGVQSMATALTSYCFTPNVLSAGTASVGYIGMSGVISGDQFYLLVFGK